MSKPTSIRCVILNHCMSRLYATAEAEWKGALEFTTQRQVALLGKNILCFRHEGAVYNEEMYQRARMPLPKPVPKLIPSLVIEFVAAKKEYDTLMQEEAPLVRGYLLAALNTTVNSQSLKSLLPPQLHSIVDEHLPSSMGFSSPLPSKAQEKFLKQHAKYHNLVKVRMLRNLVEQ